MKKETKLIRVSPEVYDYLNDNVHGPQDSMDKVLRRLLKIVGEEKKDEKKKKK